MPTLYPVCKLLQAHPSPHPSPNHSHPPFPLTTDPNPNPNPNPNQVLAHCTGYRQLASRAPLTTQGEPASFIALVLSGELQVAA